MRWRRAAGGLALAVGVVVLLVYGIGWETVTETVSEAHPGLLAGAILSGLCMLALRGLVVGRLLAPVQGGARGNAFVAAYLSGYFARSALPWGRSTGTPITAYLLAEGSNSQFEDNLAVVAAAEGFNAIASVVVAVTGFVVYTAASDSDALNAVSAAITVAGIVAVAATVLVVVVFNRGVARRVVARIAAGGEAILEKLPRVNDVRGRLTDRIDGFFDTLETIGASRRALAAAIGIAIASWVFNALPLYLCLLAVGVDAPLAVALVCAPLASFGGVVPLPGGSGGIEVVLTALLVATLGLPTGVAAGVAVLYRLTTYWTHLVIGGCVASAVSMVGMSRFG
ncbi:UPF0104 family protein [Natrarchaeobius halalkaliphilus]|uniref:UPF0104 family protein n=1 Tax=Natrarchaeobius halalkaliphilus TaxID=1679091 RepID=A0A3N6P6S9_9EURY|nr:lysylphosphatidylglycerol synthase transmembrane domain-containing protein [Natrarchaeobius halalkaliphilus]RQG91575.1 UPF0104 family protein [Natrarchaeobius halalkaliphilus]